MAENGEDITTEDTITQEDGEEDTTTPEDGRESMHQVPTTEEL